MILRPVLWSVLTMILSLSLATRIMAVGPYTWDGGGMTDNLLENLNWLDDIGPEDYQVRAGGNANPIVNVDTSIIFAGTTRLTPYVAAPGWSSDDATPPAVNPDVNANNIYNNITFDSSAGPFVISLGPGNTTGSLRLGPTRQTTTRRNLINNSPSPQTFNLPLIASWVDVAANTGDFIFNGAYNMAVGSLDRRLSISGNFGVHFNAGLTGAGTDLLFSPEQRPGGFLELLGPGKSYIRASSDSTDAAAESGLWNGQVVIINGVLEISHSTALGAGFAQSATSGRTTIGTAVANTGRLELAGDLSDDSITVSERIFVTGRSTGFATAAPHIRNLHGNNTLSGPIESQDVSNALAVVIEASDDGAGAADLLTISGNLTQSRAAGVNLVLRGNGAGVISGNILNGATPATMAWTLRKLDSGTWTINSSGNTYTGTTQVVAGTLALGASASIATSSTIHVADGGILDVTAQPNFTVGSAAAQVLKGDGSITGNVTIAAGSTFSVDYGGSAMDSLSVSGELDITNATLSFNELSPLNPGVYVFATYGTLEGAAFANVLNKPAGFNIDYDFGGNQIALVAAQPGDFDADGDVDGADFVAWQTNFPTTSGATRTQGDSDDDGDVDGADFATWQTQFPASPGPGASPVPEPASGILLAAGGALALIIRRRARQA